jgi:predicted Fe-Mo cluster-binding NifX family protein
MLTFLCCGGIGSRALELCWERGIDVYIFQAQTVDEMFNSWKNGSAKRADESGACKH